MKTRPGLLDELAQTWLNVHRGEGDSDMHRNGESWVLKQLLTNCRVVFDVGANVGQWAELALQINHELVIHAFEPNPKIHAQLAESPVATQLHLHQAGLSDTPSHAQLHVYDQHHGMTSLYQRQGLPIEATSLAEIELTTLDLFCEQAGVERIDLLKLDIEGHELAALKGARDMLQRAAIGAIQFEYGGCHVDARTFLRDFFELLLPAGYDLFKIHPKGLVKHPRYLAALDNFQHQAWLAVHEKGELASSVRNMVM